MDDIILPEFSAFNIEDEKDLETKEIESEQKLFERGLRVESNRRQFATVRKHWEELFEQYRDVRSLVDLSLPADEFMIETRVKAGIADEIARFLQMIDQVNEVDEDATE